MARNGTRREWRRERWRSQPYRCWARPKRTRVQGRRGWKCRWERRERRERRERSERRERRERRERGGGRKWRRMETRRERESHAHERIRPTEALHADHHGTTRRRTWRKARKRRWKGESQNFFEVSRVFGEGIRERRSDENRCVGESQQREGQANKPTASADELLDESNAVGSAETRHLA